MKKTTLIFTVLFAFIANDAVAQEGVPFGGSDDNLKPPATIFVQNGVNTDNPGGVFNGIIYRHGRGGAARNNNGDSNGAFGNLGHWSVDLTVSEKSPQQVAEQHGNIDGGFVESGHPVYTAGDGNLSLISDGLGSLGWGSFTANAYNRAQGLGSVALGFSTIAGLQAGINGNGGPGQYGSVGQFSAGYAARALGNMSTATGYRNTASATATVALGNYNYATGDSSIAIGKENWAEGGNTYAIGYKNHAAGGGSVALGQENIAWGTTNFTSGYQNVAGDTNAAVGTGGSAVAMGKYNTATSDTSMALNRGTSATNQAATSMGFRTISDNLGMLAIGVNNAAGLGDTNPDSYYYADGQYTGAPIGVAFVIGNGDINTTAYERGDNPSNAFIVRYDGSATLAGDLTVNSDLRLKANVTSLGNTLSRLLLIDGKKYTLKTDESVEKIGLLAQDIQKIFPELVNESGDDQGILSINYQGLVPILINAIKEQQKELEKFKKKLKSQ